MHEATITIKKLWPPYNAGAKRVDLHDLDGNKYRVEVTTAAGFHDGEVVDIGYTEEKTTAEFGGKEYKLIKKMKLVATKSGALNDLAAAHRATPSDVGPHVGMWEKEAFGALLAGLTSSEVILRGIEARMAAREILKTNLDAKLPSLNPEHGLEDTF